MARISRLERGPELLDLLWSQLLAAPHNAQHPFAFNLTLSFAGGPRFRSLAISLTVEDLGHEFEVRIRV